MDDQTLDSWSIPEDRRELVRQCSYQIERMSQALTRLLETESTDDFPVYQGMLARIQQLNEICFFALRLHGEEDDLVQCGPKAELDNLHRAYLHGASYLHGAW